MNEYAAIPDYALASPHAFMDWVMHQRPWPVLDFMPALCSCPLCAAIVFNDWGARLAHAAWHGHSVISPAEGAS